MEKDLFNGEHRWKIKEWVKKYLENKKDKDHYLQFIARNPNGVFYIESYLKQFEDIQKKDYEKDNFHKKRNIMDDLCMNPSSQYLFIKNPEWISYYYLSSNKSSWAIDLLKKNQDEIQWDSLCSNPCAIDMLNEYFDEYKSKYHKLDDYIDECKINSLYVSANTEAMHIVEHYLQLYFNECDSYLIEPHLFEDEYNEDNYLWRNPSAISIIENYYFKYSWYIDWVKLSGNPNAKEIFEKNMDKISWEGLSLNPASWAIELLEKNQDKIDWGNLSSNPSAIHILEQNLDKSHLFLEDLFINPSIFEVDYDFLKRRMDLFREELIEKTWHPDRYEEWCL